MSEPMKPGDVIRELARAYFRAVEATKWDRELSNRALALAAAIDRLVDSSELLLDYQNGPPLVSEQAEWQAAVDGTRGALAAIESVTSDPKAGK